MAFMEDNFMLGDFIFRGLRGASMTVQYESQFSTHYFETVRNIEVLWVII